MHEAPISSYGALSRPTPAVRSYCLHQSAVEDVHGFVAVLIIQSLLRPPVLSVLVPVPELSAKNENGLRKAVASMQPSSRGAIPPMSISLSSGCREWLINTCFLFFCKMLIIQFIAPCSKPRRPASPNSQRIPTGLPISKPSGPVLIGDGDREAGDSPLWSNSDQTQSVRFVSPFSWYSPRSVRSSKGAQRRR